jgi:prolyl-tRNA synthetase
VLSERGLKTGQLEYQGRRDTQATAVEVDQAHALILNKLGR